ncbi:hypothetical protein [Paracoccus shanxieyensis]|uniref:Cellulose-binding protein n=1 Tax=Paracoccus shanxieyensis TaxID=2675752 RepID=A0A6L6IWC1_9RHOB|nr:hypothetical protein [Paracoccus shanxieyensis]MTH64806.1 hypothetical protein [Paracoccus shanxieyensis]MTH87961.1 hypothetical protein [Paracoccus shanxieyensis]
MKPIADTVTDPALAVGLNGLADWSTAQPFLDHFKMARPWSGRRGDTFGAVSFAQLQAAGAIDAFGWLRAVPHGLDGVSTVLLTDLDHRARDLAGRYIAVWEGEGEVELIGGQNVERRKNRFDFDFDPAPGRLLELRVRRVDAGPIRDIRIVQQDNIRRYNSGNIFRVEWLDAIRNYRLIRFMDWMQTNDSGQVAWQDRPRPTDAFYTWRGAPVEVMVRLANAIGAQPWFNIPHLAQPEYIRRFSEYVQTYLSAGLRAHYEYSNEVWNSQFDQSLWAIEQARQLWPGQGDGFMQIYAARSVEMARILDQVHAQNRATCVKVISTHTHWQGLEWPVLEAPDWRADNPGRAAPHAYFDAYAVSGYFDGGMDRDDNVARVRALLAGPAERARTALRDQILHGGWPESGRTIASLRAVWDYQAAIARKYRLNLIMYEGGTHIIPPHEVQQDAALSEFYTRFNYSAEMGQIYQAAFREWTAAGGQGFNMFVECAGSSQYGFWGLQRFLGDENPRWAAAEAWNRDHQGDDVGADRFIGSYERPS